MTDLSILSFDPQTLPEDGITLEGELSLASLQINETDRSAQSRPFAFRIHAAPVHGGVLAQGSGSVALRCRCDRCLQYFDQVLSVSDICHFYKKEETELIDLTDDLRQDILLSFPQSVYCRKDCRGLCPQCGQNLNVRGCGCRPAADIGGAWDALDSLELPDAEDAGEL